MDRLRRAGRRSPLGMIAAAPPTEQAGRQEKHGFQEGKQGSEHHSEEAEWQRDQPDQGKQHQREQCKGPAQNEQQAPANDQQQEFHNASLPIRFVRRRSFKAPASGWAGSLPQK
jgi:hypothetical protein